MLLGERLAVGIEVHHLVRLREIRPRSQTGAIRIARPDEIRPVCIHRFRDFLVLGLPVRFLEGSMLNTRSRRLARGQWAKLARIVEVARKMWGG